MKRTRKGFAYPWLPSRILCATLFAVLASCQSSEQKGQVLFEQNCSSCHNFRTNGIGPQLGGVTETVSEDWIRSFIKDPKSMIEHADERSELLYSRYNTYMPGFAHLKQEDVDAIIALLKTKPVPAKKEFKPDGTELKDPIPAKIEMSSLVIDLKEVATIPPSATEGQKTRICKLDYRPDTKDVFVVDLRGKLYQLTDKGPQVYLDIANEMPNFINKPGLATGFGSFAFHPDFAKNSLLYTTHAESPGSGVPDFAYADSIRIMLQWVLSEWDMNTKKHREIFRVNMVSQIHGVQEITFNPLSKPGSEDYGLLYVGVGDGGAVENGYPFVAIRKDAPWGKILRIDPKVDPSKPEIYAYGFRNPHRISWTKKGQILASNIGHHNVESLNMIEKGRDYGWPEREGTFVMKYSQNMDVVYPLPPDDSINHYTYPVAEYDHDEGNAISGGLEYWGTKLDALKGKYLFGDIVKGRLFYVEMNDLAIGKQAEIKEFRFTLNGQSKTLVETTGDDKVDVRFGRDHTGEMYILTKPDGKVYKVVGAKVVPKAAM
jgi:glucose/arabinose dehydrogenase/mono/diheme cytochrome c family protein